MLGSVFELGDRIFDLTGGNIYLLLFGAFLIFYLDSMVLTILPEVLILTFVGARPDEIGTLIWLLLLLCMATIGDVTGNYTVYLLFKKVKRYHNWVYGKLQGYVGFLVLKDEKLILLNRVAPALPMCGAFMAACDWNVKRSLFYIYVGGLVKYSIILFFFGFLSLYYPENTALWITLISVVAFLIISFFLGRRERRKLAARSKAEAGGTSEPNRSGGNLEGKDGREGDTGGIGEMKDMGDMENIGERDGSQTKGK